MELQELKRASNIEFLKIKVPPTWKYEGFEHVTLDGTPDTEVQSICAKFMDTSTSGINLLRYRLNYHAYSGNMSLVQVTIVDFSRRAYNCMITNAKAETINSIINEKTD